MSHPTKTLKPLLLSLLGAALALSLGTAFWYRTALAEMVINAWQGHKLTDGLVGYWSFDAQDTDWTQNKAFDRSGQGNHGVFTNMATATAPVIGKMGQGVGFDGVDDFTTISVADTNFLGAITISAWVKPTTAGPIVSKVSGNGAINNPFDFELANESGANVLYSVRAHASSYSAYTGPVWTPGVWQHIVVVYTDGDTNTPPTYYVNGVAGAASQIFSHTTGSVTGASKPILIGKRDDGQIITSQIDDVRVYNRALSAEEVKRLYMMGNTFVTNSSQNQKLTDGLVGLWSFDAQDTDWTQNKAFDRSGQGNHGVFTNMATATAPVIGKMGQGISFDGSNDSIDMVSSPNIDANGSFSYSLWVKPRSYVNGNSGTDAGTYFLDRMSGSIVSLKAVNDKYCFQKGYDDGTSVGCVSTSENIALNEWAHIVLVRDYNSNFYIYHNGKVSGNVADTNKALSPDPLRIGCHASGARTTDGTIDDVRIYNRALSAEEVKRLYLMGGSLKINTSRSYELSDGLVGHWSFDGSDIDWSLNRALDRSGQGNHGVFTNMATATVPVIGKNGQAALFDGGNDYVDAGDVAAMDTATELTVCAWVKPGSISDDDAIVSKEIVGTTQGSLLFRDDSSFTSGFPDVYSWVVFDSTDADTVRVESPANTTILGQWVHLCGTYVANDANGLKLYMDGAGVANNPVSTVGILAINGGTGTFRIGSRSDGTMPNNGTIDNVRIYNRALSAEEVKRLYLMGK